MPGGDKAKNAGATAKQAAGTAQQTATQTASDAGQQAGQAAGDAGQQAQGLANQHQTVTGELKQVIRQAAIEALSPAAKAATTAAAKYALEQGPRLVSSQVLPKVAQAGGAKAIASAVPGKAGAVLKGATKVAGAGQGVSNLLGKLKPGNGKKDGGGPEPSGYGRGRRLPVQESVDVAVPIDVAYNQWTQFEELPKFMHRVERIEQRDDTHLMWHENIWGVRRQWEAEITEQKPNDRIVWHSTGGPKQVGVITFSKLADNLTRVQVSLDFQPQGLFEKTASGTRITRRALMSDLMRFKAFIEMRDEETGAWRGLVEEGEVKDQEGEEQEGEEPEGQEEGQEPEDQAGEYDEAESDEEPEEDEGAEAEYDEDEYDEDEEDEGDEEPGSESDEYDEDEYDEDEGDEEEEPEAEADEDEEPEAEAEEEPEPEPEPEPKPRRKPAAKRTPRKKPQPAGRSARS